ncbi:gamma-butyrobetaine dioxygenase-like isoform X2 [Ylistrum balloti]|uniref:gamma-butyrobetaine dioxygenase-like isoform X2 n=1 Tax=Ylistrum balloti TaxID=509963 RepID=UPI0029058E39|nr:gamma-butyrobetaine dioxygenase-like isoform X2 [Ylistrum balloti]
MLKCVQGRRRLLKLVSRCSSVGFTFQTGPAVPLITPQTCLFDRHLDRHQPFSSGTPVSPSANTVNIVDDGRKVEIVWNDCKTSRFHAVWLRHHCQCEECFDAEINQVLIEIDKLPLDIKATNVRITDGKVWVEWNGNHIGEFSTAFLRKHCYSGDSLTQKKASLKTSLYTKPTLASVTWTDCETDEKHIYRLLKDINDHGLAMVKAAPTTKELLTEFVPKHMTSLWDNTYGKLYDVTYMEKATNLAYTQKALQFHMDLTFYESTPGIQFLHCLKFDESLTGGETTFVDMFAVCEELRQTNPAEFKTLCSVPCTFSRDHSSRDHPVHLGIQRPIINLNREKEIIGVFWNPSVVGVQGIPEDDVADYYKAYQLFARAIKNFHTKNEVRLQPGDIVAFNNRRMAHSRNSFGVGSGHGERHFQGCYINICEYKSRLIHLSRKFGDDSAIKRVGNMDWT